MSKFLLTAVALAALGLETSADEQSISASIEELHRKHKAAVLEKTELEAKLTKFQEAQVKTLIDGAVESGKLSAEVTEDFRKMATENYALAAKVIAGMPAKKSLAGQVSNSTPEEVKTLEDFQKLPLEKQLAFKQDNPDAYKAIVK
jgi:phenylacetate-coenzyme A ligase PaaK-like adenylate-forming protein